MVKKKKNFLNNGMPKENGKIDILRIFYVMFIICLFKYNFKLLTAINLFYTLKKRLLMLVYQAEVITFSKIFIQKIMLSV